MDVRYANIQDHAITHRIDDTLLDAIGDAHYVLLGEATHGTHEFYMKRAQITRRLIEEKGFTIVALEADWSAALHMHRFIQGSHRKQEVLDALSEFKVFPLWMWRNQEMLTFIAWLASYNQTCRPARTVGIYGLDLYSLHASMKAVINYLYSVDPALAKEAIRQYSCFDMAGQNPQDYGFNVEHGLVASCADVAKQQLERLQQGDYVTDRHKEDELFFAAQHARVVVNAEQYYRSMFNPQLSSWNLRDTHMADTVDQLVAHYHVQGRPAKVVVWAHNSHVGDARATYMGTEQLNIGQLMRERHGHKTYIVGFTTYNGTVAAADDWDTPVKLKHVRSAIEGSYEQLFHSFGYEQFLLLLHDNHKRLLDFGDAYAERAIGVIYRPQAELQSHYFQARIEDQFNAVMHIDRTSALQPLDRTAGWQEDQLDETYPMGV